MNRLPIFAITTSSLLLLSISVAFGQQSKFDQAIPAEEIVQSSLAVATKLASMDKLTADDIRQIYFAEKIIGRCVWGVSEKDSALGGSHHIAAHNYFTDSTVGEQCLLYIRNHRNRFKVVSDGWKGENNFWEPTRYWAEQVNKRYPNSTIAKEIEFDLEFNAFIRRFVIDEEAKGKTCEEYFKEHIEPNLDVYLDVMTKEELYQWPSDCNRVREEFTRGRLQLLEKYGNAPFTKILQDIDPTMIVVIYSIC